MSLDGRHHSPRPRQPAPLDLPPRDRRRNPRRIPPRPHGPHPDRRREHRVRRPPLPYSRDGRPPHQPSHRRRHRPDRKPQSTKPTARKPLNEPNHRSLEASPSHPPHPPGPLGRRLRRLPLNPPRPRRPHRPDARRRRHRHRHRRPPPLLRPRCPTQPAIQPTTGTVSSTPTSANPSGSRLRHTISSSSAIPTPSRSHSQPSSSALLSPSPAGIWSAIHRGHWQDRTLGIVSLVGLSFPNFALGPILILLFSIQLGWLPVSGAGTDPTSFLLHLILPAITPRPRSGRHPHPHGPNRHARRAQPGLHPHRPRQGPH